MLAGTIVARLRADTTQFSGGIAKAEAETRALQKSTASGIQTLEKSETALARAGGASYGLSRRLYGLQQITQLFSKEAGSGLLGFSSRATVTFAAVSAAVVAFGKYSVDAYEEHEKALIRLEGAIHRAPALVGETTKSFLDQAHAVQELTGFQDEEVMAADAVLARFKLTGDQIRAIIPLVADYARITGQDMATSASNLGRAFLGNTRALKLLGIQFKATGDITKDFNTLFPLLQSKVEGTAKAFGETMGGKVQILKADLQDLGVVVGGAIVPSIGQLVGALTETARAAVPVVDVLAAMLRTIAPLLPIAAQMLLIWGAWKLGSLLLFKALSPILGILLPLKINLAETTLGAEGLAAAEGHAAAASAALGSALGVLAGIMTLGGALLIFKEAPSVISDLTTSVGDLKKELSGSGISTGVTGELDKQLGGLMRSSSTAERVRKAGEIITHQYEELVAKGIPAAQALEMVNHAALQTASVLGGTSGNFEQFARDLRGAALGAIPLTAAQMEHMGQSADVWSGQLNGARVIWERYVKSLETSLGPDQARTIRDVLGGSFTSLAADMKAAADKGGTALDQFMADTEAKAATWRSSLADSFNFVQGSLDTLAGKAHLTARGIVREFDSQLRQMNRYQANWTLVSETFGNKADGMLAALAQMGPKGASIMDAMATSIRRGNTKMADQAISDFNRAGDKAKGLANTIADTIGGTLNDIKDILTAIAKKWGISVNLDDNASVGLQRINSELSRIGNIYIVANKGKVIHAGGPIMHAGGEVPRFHTGGGFPLRSDERHAILQVGEYVLNRRAVSHFGMQRLNSMNRMQEGAAGTGSGGGGSAISVEDPTDRIVRALERIVLRLSIKLGDRELAREVMRDVRLEVTRTSGGSLPGGH